MSEGGEGERRERTEGKRSSLGSCDKSSECDPSPTVLARLFSDVFFFGEITSAGYSELLHSDS